VLLGHGERHVLAQPVKYPEPRPGAWQIVLGDFQRANGILGRRHPPTTRRSTATIAASRSRNWDSVLDSAGPRPDGTFGAASSFSLGDQSKADQRALLQEHRGLAEHVGPQTATTPTDLIASWGAVLINKPADPKLGRRTVTASSTATRPQRPFSDDQRGRPNDSDQDMLLLTAGTDSGGQPLPPVSTFLPFSPGTARSAYLHRYGRRPARPTRPAARSPSISAAGSGKPATPAVGRDHPRRPAARVGGRRDALHHPLGNATERFGADQLDSTSEFSTDDGRATMASSPAARICRRRARSCQWNDPDPPTERARVFILAEVDQLGRPASPPPIPSRIRTSGGGGSLPAGMDPGATSVRYPRRARSRVRQHDGAPWTVHR